MERPFFCAAEAGAWAEGAAHGVGGRSLLGCLPGQGKGGGEALFFTFARSLCPNLYGGSRRPLSRTMWQRKHKLHPSCLSKVLGLLQVHASGGGASALIRDLRARARACHDSLIRASSLFRCHGHIPALDTIFLSCLAMTMVASPGAAEAIAVLVQPHRDKEPCSHSGLLVFCSG